MLGSRLVFRCFKACERLGDRITGAAGPFFVAFAVILTGLGSACFFTILLPTLSYPFLTTPICILIALNMHGHYFLVTRVPPGFVNPDHRSTPPPQGRGGSSKEARKYVLHLLSTCRMLTRTSARTIVGYATAASSNTTTIVLVRLAFCHFHLSHSYPGINQCVGLHNERHFVLFMAYLVIGCVAFCYAGWETVLRALGFGDRDWMHWDHTIPSTIFLLIYILAAVMSLAVGIMVGFHLRTVANGETTVESQDNDVYRKMAKSRAEAFVNSYDLGSGLRNIALFFNVAIGKHSPSPAPYPLYSLFLPMRIQPYTDGWSWARRDGYEQGHAGVRRGEELTDDDEEFPGSEP
ncbi:Palmitoyltransferase [Mycena indigotica]|uniref:Palmitoyltransferase n=1 Tax=Mycena indigotica TaxID=2126181 RepID=A0A8H6S4T9_9AGAR|nr:Palmitoyltransferase [Mycena indigotica]KAF7291325.1 Palmitoyltransferase [Mycena indigotica]